MVQVFVCALLNLMVAKQENEFRDACKVAYADDSYMTAEQAIFILDVIGNQL